MHMSWLVAIVPGVIFGVSVMLIDTVIIRWPQTKEVAREKTLSERLDELSESMRESARLMEEVQAELDARAALVKKMKGQVQDGDAHAVLPRVQAEVNRRIMDNELEGTAHSIRKYRLLVARLITGGCVAFAVAVTLHMLY